jgi:hypothetical protein
MLEEAFAIACRSTWMDMFGGRSPHWRPPIVPLFPIRPDGRLGAGLTGQPG